MPAIQFMTVADQTGTVPVNASDTSAKSLKVQGLQAAFSNYMQRNSTGTAQTASQQNAMMQQPAKTPADSGQVQQQYERQQGPSAAQADKVTSASGETGALDESAAGTVEEAVEKITEAIKENLGVDEEQIQAAMELLGLTQADLLNAQNLVALSVELTGSENAGMMLFNENFQNLMQEAAAITDDLLKDLGMTMDELMGRLQTPTDTLVQNPQDMQAVPEQTVQTMPKDTQTIQENVLQPAESAVQEPEAIGASQKVQEVQPETTPDTQAVTDSRTSQEAVVSAQAADTQEQPAEEAVQTQGQQEGQTEPAVPVQEQTQGQTAQPETSDQPQSGREGFQRKEVREPNAEDVQNRNVPNTPRFDFTSNIQPVTAAPVQPNISAQIPMPQVDMQNVIEQIVEYTRVNLSEEVKSIEMQLNPENLGKIYLHVSEKQGTVTAQLTAQNENMKEALVQQAAILKETLNQQGIRVDAVEVSAGTHEFENNLERDAHSQEEQARQQEEQNARRSRRSINLNDMDSLDSISGLMSEEEALVAQIMRDNGNNVDYKA